MRSPIITIGIACTARSMARRPRNVPAHPYLLLPRLVVTPGGSIAAVCSKHQLPPDRQFATHRVTMRRSLANLAILSKAGYNGGVNQGVSGHAFSDPSYSFSSRQAR